MTKSAALGVVPSPTKSGTYSYVLGALLVAVSVGFPLFLIARERRMAAADAPRVATADSVMLTVLCLALTALSLWVAFS